MRCNACAASYHVSAEDHAFHERVSPYLQGRSFPFPPPDRCPACRKRLRMAYHNDMHLYQRRSSLSGKPLISIYHEAQPFPVYEHAEWWSDTWDARAYGRPFDFARPFFVQLAELLSVVPRPNIYASDCENCSYCNAANCKNCYLIGAASNDQDCYYSYRINYSSSCCDCLLCWRSELCYECSNLRDCYRCSYSSNISNCVDSYFLYDCSGCNSCCCCVGLKNKSYCIFNQQYSANEYATRLAALRLSSLSGVQSCRTAFSAFLAPLPRRAAHLINVEAVSGDCVRNAKNCQLVFDAEELQDVSYCQFASRLSDCQDVNWGFDSRLNYECCMVGIDCSNLAFCLNTWPSVHDLYYCLYCQAGTANCFGCVGLKRNEYCILNKQYTQQEYTELLPRVIEHMQHSAEWGRFFPSEYSPFGYNETVAQDYFPRSREQALADGYRWHESENKARASLNEASLSIIPDQIAEVNDAVLEYAFHCPQTGKPFRYIRQELELYRREGIPLPRLHPQERHRQRLAARPARQLWQRRCTRCKEICDSCYAPESAELVYCQECYRQAVG
jgi:hypothetical protein